MKYCCAILILVPICLFIICNKNYRQIILFGKPYCLLPYKKISILSKFIIFLFVFITRRHFVFKSLVGNRCQCILIIY